METLTLGRFLTLLGRDSLEAGVLVLAVLLTQWLLGNRLSPRWRSALWLLVMLRLLLVVSVGSVVSVFNLLPHAQPAKSAQLATAVPDGVPGQTAALVHPPTIVTMPLATIMEPRPVAAPVAGDNNASSAAMAASPQVASQSPTTAQDISRPLDWVRILFLVWLAGAGLLAVYVLAGSIRVSRRIARLAPVADPQLRERLNECAAQLGVGGRLEVVEDAGIATPALHGFLRPRLLLPPGFTRQFSAQEQRFILLHELAHVKRRDILLNWLAAALQVVHWFNPLIWLGFARWRADRELACDALALEAAGGDQNQAYGRTILRLLENFTPRTAMPGLVGILEDKKQLRERIKMIAGFRAGRRLGLATAALLGVLGIVCLTDAQSPAAKEGAGKKPAADVSAAQTEQTGEARRGADPLPTVSGTNVPAQSLTVTVLDAATGQPLPEAEVEAPYAGDMLDSQPRRLTDAQGKYVVQIKPVPKEYRRQQSVFLVSARHEGYASRSAGWTSSAGDVEAMMPQELTIKLERGITLGGVVQDERGQPLAGVRVLLSGSDYSGFRMGTNDKKAHDFAEVGLTDKAHPAAVTDANGRWVFEHFPSDLDTVTITFVRPDDSRYNYVTLADRGLNEYPIISMRELRATNAVTVLPDGIIVRGLVTDEAGQPIAGATVKEGYGHVNQLRVSEFKTDGAGRFERLHRAPRQWIYTATADGRAMVSTVAQVESNMPEVRLVLPPAKPLVIHVTDTEGKPVAEAKLVIHPNRNDGQLLDWRGNTDASGVSVWTNAPVTPVTFYVVSDTPASSKQFSASAADGEKTVVLGQSAAQKATVKIRAFDSRTQAPVTIRSVAVEYNGDFTRKVVSEPKESSASIEIRATDFRVGMSPEYKVQVNAEGYDPFITDYVDLAQGDQNLAAAMVRGEPADGVALEPDGKPAVGARIWVRPTDNSGAVFANAVGRYYGDRLAKTNTDENGRFVLPPVQGNQPVVMISSNGFLETKVEEIKRTHKAQLQAWGRVEGVFKIAGKPKGGVSVNIETLQWTPALGFQLIYTTSTKPDGGFVFEQVPAGEYRLYLDPARRIGRPITKDHQLPLVVKAGETTKIEYSNAGREVIGQAVPDKPGVAVDWLNDDDTLTLKQTVIPAINREDFASFKAFTEANNASWNSPARLAQARAARTYVLKFDQDGSFRAQDVPPGTYELNLNVTKPDKNQRFVSSLNPPGALGSLTREVVVPPGEGPFDLGTLTVPMKGDAAGATKSPPVDLSATTLDGRPVSLEQYRGKYLVLAFWATWSDRCTEELQLLAKLQDQWKNDPRLAFLGVSLDDDKGTVAKVVQARGYPWTQATMTATNLGRAAAAFDMSRLPAVYLIDPGGRVLGRDLTVDRLAATVQRAMRNK